MAASHSGNRKLWILIIILLLVIVGGGGAAVGSMMAGGHGSADKQATAKTDKKTKTPPPKPVFFELKPFTVNLQGGVYGSQLLYVHITLQLGDKVTQKFLKEHMPQVRNRLLLVLSGQHGSVLTTRKGKKALATSIRAALLKPMTKTQPDLKISKVLFTQFIVQ